jgi:hypothetical protein
MPIPQRRIVDRDSFLDTTASPRDAAALYFFKHLDAFFDSAQAVSVDLFARPQLYTAIPDRDGNNIVRVLAILRSRCGSDELIPSHAQREEMYSPIFGPIGGSADFDKLRDDLIAAATAFAERVFNTGEDMLRERVRTAHRPLKDYLTGVTGASTNWSARNPLDNIGEEIAFRILRASSISSVFGVGTAPRTSWPYAEDSNADKLLEEMTAKIYPTSGLTRQQASNRQRLAARGAEAIASVIDYTENSADPADDVASLGVLITQCYTWGAAKKALMR